MLEAVRDARCCEGHLPVSQLQRLEEPAHGTHVLLDAHAALPDVLQFQQLLQQLHRTRLVKFASRMGSRPAEVDQTRGPAAVLPVRHNMEP